MLPVLADGTNRTTTSDVKLGPHLIPKGTMVWIPLKGLFNSPHNWADPKQYSPVCSHPILMPLPSLFILFGKAERWPSQCTVKLRPVHCIQERWEDANAEYALPLDSKLVNGLRHVHNIAVDAMTGVEVHAHMPVCVCGPANIALCLLLSPRLAELAHKDLCPESAFLCSHFLTQGACRCCERSGGRRPSEALLALQLRHTGLCWAEPGAHELHCYCCYAPGALQI